MVWELTEPGVLELPSGRRVRGRSMRVPALAEPDFGLYLLWSAPSVVWPHRWVRWPDFGIPLDGTDAHRALVEVWERSGDQRVEVACGGGRGRTGTALAGLAMLDGLDRDAAIRWIRTRYHPRAVETPWQRAWLTR